MSDRVHDAHGGWHFYGNQRPAFAIEPRPAQESVWDYPRPPVCVADNRRITVYLDACLIADTSCAARILETAGAPTFYLPPADVDMTRLIAATGSSFCEWKGAARYWHVTDARRTAHSAAWAYPDATGRFADIAGYVAFYARALDCCVDGERARPQPGGLYGGWVTDDVVGPFKGEAGTGDW